MATKIEGVDKLKRKMTRFSVMARKEIAAAMEQSAEELVRLMKSLAPVDDGDLQMSINWTWGDAPKGSMVLGSVRNEGKGVGNMAITVYAGGGKAYYARWVEFGTSAHINGGRFPGTQHPGTIARPFFFPAYRSMRKRIKGRTSRAIRKAARTTAAGG
ncbi:HK97 family phage protein [Devosia limi DSM 17137]|uniref:HK97 family phage protein n=1 Tax=Devosia limi DSM 17137 TaxID=1121477 RepID=A0A0F5LXT2_9HYPH|nr:HK97-gp10 family putative phage morphogenesis protein [Devosia limi]KKB86467.1 HK97 family phage protein [Devosia limi DSM 17137]SHE87878.1 phage protein, HK97 gp10 family [Devosia limi DSM 17137]